MKPQLRHHHLITLLAVFVLPLLLVTTCKIQMPVEEQEVPYTYIYPIADAGPDMECAVGQIAVLDGSKSTPGLLMVWEESDNNPGWSRIHGDWDRTPKSKVAFFGPEGEYTYYLTVIDLSRDVRVTDSVKVTVGPRESFVFDEVSFEIAARHNISEYTGELTDEKLKKVKKISVREYYSGLEEKSLIGLEKCVNLEYLHLNGEEYLTDLRPLTNLTKMKTLKLSQIHNLSDISALRNMHDLEWLDIFWVCIDRSSNLLYKAQLRIAVVRRHGRLL